MARFSERLRGVKKVDNHRAMLPAKVELRRNVLAAVAGPVFEAFAGSGEMYRQVWKDAPAYVGCDTRWFPDGRAAFVADNRRVLRAIDLSPFLIFDLDAYGSPWEQATIIAARRQVAPGESLGLILTDGTGFTLKMGGLPTALALLTGMATAGLSGIARASTEIRDRAILELCRRMGCVVVRRWQATGKSGAKVVYVGLVLRGLAAGTP